MLVKNDLLEVNDHWFSCDYWHPKGAWYAWVFGKMPGIECRCFPRSPHSLPLLLIFCTCSQFHFLRILFWKCVLCRLPWILLHFDMINFEAIIAKSFQTNYNTFASVSTANGEVHLKFLIRRLCIEDVDSITNA